MAEAKSSELRSNRAPPNPNRGSVWGGLHFREKHGRRFGFARTHKMQAEELVLLLHVTSSMRSTSFSLSNSDRTCDE